MSLTDHEDDYTEIGTASSSSFFLFRFPFLLVQRFGMAARDLISWRWAHLARRQTPVARRDGVFAGRSQGVKYEILVTEQTDLDSFVFQIEMNSQIWGWLAERALCSGGWSFLACCLFQRLAAMEQSHIRITRPQLPGGSH